MTGGTEPARVGRRERTGNAPIALLLGAIWGFTYLVIKWGLRDTGPMTLGALRVLVGSAGLLTLARWREGPMPTSAQAHRQIALVGLLQVGLFVALLNLGTARVGAGIAALIVYTQPLLVAALGAVWFQVRLDRLQVVGLLAGVFGLVLVLSNRLQSGGEAVRPGYALLFAAALSWTLGILLFKRFRPALPFLWAVALQTVYGAIPLVIAAVALEGLAMHVTARLLAVTLFLGIVASGLAYLLWFRLLTGASAVVASVSLLLVPIYASLFGALLLGEKWTALSFLGAFFILASIGLVSRPAPQSGLDKVCESA